MRETSSSSVTSVSQGERLSSSGRFKELNTRDLATTESRSEKRSKARPERHIFFLMVWTSLDLKKVKEMLESKLLNTLAFLAHTFVTLEST